jgi:hypothetical protein
VQIHEGEREEFERGRDSPQKCATMNQRVWFINWAVAGSREMAIKCLRLAAVGRPSKGMVNACAALFMA